MIITNKNELNEPCEEVLSFDDGMSIIDTLDKELSEAAEPGIGLAANQIGINKQVFIIRLPPEDEDSYGRGYNFINPKITERRQPIVVKDEGCLSFPNEHLETLRFNHIKIIDFLSPEGRTLTGLAAICAEHEYDHTQGRTMHLRKRNQIGPNERCPCESGKKFKKCCLPNIKAYPGVKNVIRPSDIKNFS